MTSLSDNAAFLRHLTARARKRNGAKTSAILSLNSFEADQLDRIATRLERMAPIEPQIRKMVGSK